MTIGPPHAGTPYPFARLDAARAAAQASELDLIDFGVGDPQDATPAFIRNALRDAITERSSYPKAAGRPELREAISDWFEQRFGVELTDDQVMPTLGSKEIIHDLPAYLLTEDRNVVLVPTPAYPVYARGAAFHGAEIVEMPLLAEHDFLPDLDALTPELLDRTALMWLNYPNNPTGALAPFDFYQRVIALSQCHGFVVASDEAYSEIWFDESPVSLTQAGPIDNLLVVNTLSKRSCVTGYRSGFLAGDPAIVRRIRAYRASTGTTPQDFVQLASVAAWRDERHVEELRQVWRTKRDLFAEVFTAAGLEVSSPATFFLWARCPNGVTSEAFAEALVQIGLVVSPGTIFGAPGEGFVRLATVPTLARCEEAAQRLREYFATSLPA